MREFVSLLLVVLLALLVRKLIWCLRWLWCYHRGRETPAPIPFLPRLAGRNFDAHVRQARPTEPPAGEREEP